MKQLSFRNYLLFFLFVTFTVMLPQPLKMQKFLNPQNLMTILASRPEPPRIAFNEIFQQRKNKPARIDEFEVLKLQRPTRNLNEDLENANPRKNPLSDFRVRKIELKQMVFNYQQALPLLQGSRWAKADLQQAIQNFQSPDISTSSPIFSPSQKPTVVEVAGSGLIELSSKIQLDSGLPFGGDYHLILQRYEDGIAKEIGAIDSVKGIYKIQVSELSGTLKAQVVHNNGFVLGEGIERISFLKIKTPTERMAPTILVRKNPNQVAANSRSFANSMGSFGGKAKNREKTIVANFQSPTLGQDLLADEPGAIKIDRVVRKSHLIVQAVAPGYYPTSQILTSGAESAVTFFSEEMIKALKEISADFRKTSEHPQTGSVVWGRVVQNGRALAGASIVIQGHENYQPIYFNQLLLPDFSATATSENGFFAILDLPEGLQSLKVLIGKKNAGFENFLVSDNAVNPLLIETDLILESVDVKVYDALSGDPAFAQVDLQSNEGLLEVSGSARVVVPEVKKLTIARVLPDSTKYSEAEYYFQSGEDYIHLPLLETQWLYDIQTSQNIEKNEGLGTVVGFVTDSDFQVYLPHEKKYLSSNIVYFDSSGKVTGSGKVGGGFILFNVPIGIQSVTILNRTTAIFSAEVIEAREKRLTVLKYTD